MKFWQFLLAILTLFIVGCGGANADKQTKTSFVGTYTRCKAGDGDIFKPSSQIVSFNCTIDNNGAISGFTTADFVGTIPAGEKVGGTMNADGSIILGAQLSKDGVHYVHNWVGPAGSASWDSTGNQIDVYGCTYNGGDTNGYVFFSP